MSEENYYPKNKIKKVYPEPGIYRLFLLEKGSIDLVYIGQSVNLRKRLIEHNKTVYMEFTYFNYDFYSRTKLDEVERKELNNYREKNGNWPKYNNQGGNRKSVN